MILACRGGRDRLSQMRLVADVRCWRKAIIEHDRMLPAAGVSKVPCKQTCASVLAVPVAVLITAYGLAASLHWRQGAAPPGISRHQRLRRLRWGGGVFCLR